MKELIVKNKRPHNYFKEKNTVLATMKQRYDKNLSLSSNAIAKEDVGLYKAIYRHFNKWEVALSEFEKVFNLKINRKITRPKGYFNDKKNLLIEIKKRYNENKTMVASEVKLDDGALLNAAYKHFTTWENALKSTEEFYKIEIYRENKRRDYGYFNNDNNIIYEIRHRVENDLDINARAVYLNDGSLYNSGCEKFGSWDNAIIAAGYHPLEIRKDDYWTQEKVIESIQERNKRGLPLNQHELVKDNEPLFSACRYLFGNYRLAVESSGIDYDEALDLWTPDKVLDELKTRNIEGLSMNYTSLEKDDMSLLSAAIHYFGSYKEAVESCGFDYSEIKLTKDWDHDKVINELKYLYINKIPMNSSFMKQEYCSLYGAAISHFGSYENAILSLGLNYDDIREDGRTLSYYGIKFEHLLGDILNDLNIIYNKGYSREVKPDFITKHERWIDAKLSEWTESIPYTVEKYEPHCKLLTIVFLRGNIHTDKKISNKTRIVSIYKLIKQLPKQKRKHYKKIANELWRKSNKIKN